jgi:hypothetical protein
MRSMKKLRSVLDRLLPHPQPPMVPLALKLLLSDDGLHYVDDLGREHSIGWHEIRAVLWCEPDYGYGWFGSCSHWVVKGDGKSINIDDHSSLGSSNSELSQWFSKKLPGFDVQIVEKAFKRGYLGVKEPPGEILECWSRDIAI